MRRRSCFSRIVRAGTDDGPSLAPVRVLFRPAPPIPEGLRAESPAIFPAELTPVELRSGGDPFELPRKGTRPSEHLVSPHDTCAPVAPVGRPPVAESCSAV